MQVEGVYRCCSWSLGTSSWWGGLSLGVGSWDRALREGDGSGVYPQPLQDTEILDSAMYRSRANLGRKRRHRAPAIPARGTLGLSEAAASDGLFQDSTGRARLS